MGLIKAFFDLIFGFIGLVFGLIGGLIGLVFSIIGSAIGLVVTIIVLLLLPLDLDCSWDHPLACEQLPLTAREIPIKEMAGTREARYPKK